VNPFYFSYFREAMLQSIRALSEGESRGFDYLFLCDITFISGGYVPYFEDGAKIVVKVLNWYCL
jgi:hypothetical protein